MTERQRRLQLFDRLWSRSANDVVEVVIPSRAQVKVPLPGPSWHYLLEVARFGENDRIFLDPFWEQKEFTIELIVMTGERCVLGIAAGDGLGHANLLKRMLSGVMSDPDPQCLFRWHVAGSTQLGE